MGVLMGVLMLRCSATGREFSTGIYADEESLRTPADTLHKAECPHCGKQHSWRTSEARLNEDIEPSQWRMFGRAS
jgi:hypothetical protein